jgi:hypothetical protein
VKTISVVLPVAHRLPGRLASTPGGPIRLNRATFTGKPAKIGLTSDHLARRARQRDRLTSTVPVPGVQRLDCERPATGHGFGVGRHCQRAGFSSDYLGMGVTATIFPEDR